MVKSTSDGKEITYHFNGRKLVGRVQFTLGKNRDK